MQHKIKITNNAFAEIIFVFIVLSCVKRVFKVRITHIVIFYGNSLTKFIQYNKIIKTNFMKVVFSEATKAGYIRNPTIKNLNIFDKQ